MTFHEYQVVGRKKPTASDPEPPIYRMSIFAKDKVRARSRFWYFLSKNSKVKKSSGEILQVTRILHVGNRGRELSKIRNYGILCKYESRSGEHNLYKEFRCLTRTQAVCQLYQDMAGRHRARYRSIHIVEVKELADEECIRPNVQQMLDPNIKFPLPRRLPRAPSRSLKSRYSSAAIKTHFN